MSQSSSRFFTPSCVKTQPTEKCAAGALAGVVGERGAARVGHQPLGLRAVELVARREEDAEPLERAPLLRGGAQHELALHRQPLARLV